MRRYSDSTTGTGAMRTGRRILWGLLLLAFIPAGMARSSPIRQRQLATGGVHRQSEWDRFLSGGPALWSRVSPPEITSQIHVVMHHAMRSVNALSNPNVQYLIWRR